MKGDFLKIIRYKRDDEIHSSNNYITSQIESGSVGGVFKQGKFILFWAIMLYLLYYMCYILLASYVLPEKIWFFIISGVARYSAKG